MSPRMRIVLVLVLEVSCGGRVEGIMVLIWWRMWVRVSWVELFIVIDRGGGLDVYWASRYLRCLDLDVGSIWMF